MADLTSRPFRPNPDWCCEACLGWKGPHSDWCPVYRESLAALDASKWGPTNLAPMEFYELPNAMTSEDFEPEPPVCTEVE